MSSQKEQGYRYRFSNSAGREIFEIHPIILGGNPTDPSNKVLLTREEHIKAVRYWNDIIRNLRNKNKTK
jgi:hypothetical protein